MNVVIRECLLCDKKVEMRKRTQKYCEVCSVIAEKKRKQNWHKDNYKYKLKTVKPRVCEYCGSEEDVWHYKKRKNALQSTLSRNV